MVVYTQGGLDIVLRAAMCNHLQQNELLQSHDYIHEITNKPHRFIYIYSIHDDFWSQLINARSEQPPIFITILNVLF